MFIYVYKDTPEEREDLSSGCASKNGSQIAFDNDTISETGEYTQDSNYAFASGTKIQTKEKKIK